MKMFTTLKLLRLFISYFERIWGQQTNHGIVGPFSLPLVGLLIRMQKLPQPPKPPIQPSTNSGLDEYFLRKYKISNTVLQDFWCYLFRITWLYPGRSVQIWPNFEVDHSLIQFLLQHCEREGKLGSSEDFEENKKSKSTSCYSLLILAPPKLPEY